MLEEHSVYGGLGTAVTEISMEHAPTRVLRIGVEDRFSVACGSYESLMAEQILANYSSALKIKKLSFKGEPGDETPS